MHLAQLSDAKCWQVENNNDNSQHVDVTPLVNTPTSGDVYKIFSYTNNKYDGEGRWVRPSDNGVC